MRIAVIGAGSWGTALAAHLARAGHAVVLWALESDVVAGIRSRHRNPLFLSAAVLPESLDATAEIGEAVTGAEVVMFVVPVQHARAVLRTIGSGLGADAVLVSASKGIEVATLERMDEITTRELGLPIERFIALSGPSFAREVVAGMPTAAVLAGSDAERLRAIQTAFSTAAFRFYTASDVIGVELAGALKNVVALAAGMASGLGLGHNAVAALLTRGLHEITRLGVRLGGCPETFRGLAGMGDLVLTCTGELSRNRAAGERLGRGEALAAVISGREVAEGVPTTSAAAALARRHGVDMPLTFAIEAILAGQLAPGDAVWELMRRELKAEALL